MIEIPLNVKVYCSDGLAGHSTNVVVDIETQNMTHIVVAEQHHPFRDHLVPLKLIQQTKPDAINLTCSLNDLVRLPHFTKTGHVRSLVPDYRHLPAQPAMMPHLTRYVEKEVLVKTEDIPVGEEAIHRGAGIEATDGQIGVLEELLIDPAEGHITHLILRKGHLWGKTDVLIPVEAVATFDEKTIYLRLNKAAINKLPTVPTLKQRKRYQLGKKAYSYLWGLN